MTTPMTLDQFLAYAVDCCVNGSSGRIYGVTADVLPVPPIDKLPCIDDPPPGTVCPQCGRPVQLWKPIVCLSDSCDYREEDCK